jgi:hypothetical protein
MKSIASSQITDAVVAEWQSACETHGFAMFSQKLRSVLTDASGNMSQNQVFICTKLEQTRNKGPLLW